MIDALIEIAQSAGQIIMAVRHSGELAVEDKHDASPLTRADTASNTHICRELSTRFDFPIQSEEARVPFDERKHWETFWLVDPLDGTREFVNGLDDFCINIALVSGDYPTLGIIYLPVTEEVFFGEIGSGAFSRKKDRIEALPSHPSCRIMARSRYHSRPLVDHFASLNGLTEHQAIGAAVKFGRLASGQIGIYPRFEECKEWDTAAGQVILQEAGGHMMDLTTNEALKYNKKHYVNNPFLACAAGIDLQSLKLPELI